MRGGSILVRIFAVVSRKYAVAYINDGHVMAYCLDHSL